MTKTSRLLTPVLITGSLIMMISFGIRASFGVFQIPVQDAFGWTRTDFSLAIAVQNLAWGIGQPLFGAFAERFGDKRAIFLGTLTYALGLLLTSMASSPFVVQSLEVLIGFGVAGTGFGVILAMVGRASSDEHRSLALGVATAAGSAGQVFGPPLTQMLINAQTITTVFQILSVVVLVCLLFLPFLKAPVAQKAELEESLGAILKKAARDPSYNFIFLGFFSCGFQLAFITAHFPAFVTETCGPISAGGILSSLGISTTAALGAASIAVIGVFNIIGTILAGYLGKFYSRKYLLSSVYLARTVVAAWFIMIPMTPATVLIFSALMGGLWLATVPLTSGLVAHIYGLRYMGTLYGIVFLSHQIGGFLGVWLGGKFYDIYGNYMIVWWVGVGVGLFSALIHLPIIEKPFAQRGVREA